MSSSIIGPLVVLGGMAVLYQHYNSTGHTAATSTASGLPLDDEVDVSRWRHDGTQPTSERSGNSPHEADSNAEIKAMQAIKLP